MYARTQTTDMTKGNALRHILTFAVPLLIGTVFQQLYSFFDTMAARRDLGDQAIAAIGASGAFYSLIISFANGLNSGCGLILSRAFRAKDIRLFREAASAMLLLNAIITAALTTVALLSLETLPHLLDTPEEIFADAYSYIFIILGVMALTVLYKMCAAFFRAVGSGRVPL